MHVLAGTDHDKRVRRDVADHLGQYAWIIPVISLAGMPRDTQPGVLICQHCPTGQIIGRAAQNDREGGPRLRLGT